MKTTVGIVNWNSGHLLQQCVESVLRVTNLAVCVLDNDSKDNSMGLVPGESERVKIIRKSKNLGFAGGVNEIFRATRTPYVLILNPDVRVLPGSIELMEDFMETHPRAAAVGGDVGEKYLPRGLPTPWSLALENLGGKRGRLPNLENGLGRRPLFPKVEQVAAAAALIRREPYKETAMFDDSFYPAWYEDVDFCRRLKRDGWEVYFAPDAKFAHDGGYSAKTMGGNRFVYAYYRNQVRYAQKWFAWHEIALVRASVVAGAIGRIVARPSNIAGYSKVMFGALIGW